MARRVEATLQELGLSVDAREGSLESERRPVEVGVQAQERREELHPSIGDEEHAHESQHRRSRVRYDLQVATYGAERRRDARHEEAGDQERHAESRGIRQEEQ